MFDLILQTRKEILEDFDKNKKKYFDQISQIARKFSGKAYLFGSYLKGKTLAGSDVDILIVIPDETDRISVLKDLCSIQNPRFEFHVIFEKEKEIYFRLIKDLKEI